jgi:hypothetical protein
MQGKLLRRMLEIIVLVTLEPEKIARSVPVQLMPSAAGTYGRDMNSKD